MLHGGRCTTAHRPWCTRRGRGRRRSPMSRRGRRTPRAKLGHHRHVGGTRGPVAVDPDQVVRGCVEHARERLPLPLDREPDLLVTHERSARPYLPGRAGSPDRLPGLQIPMVSSPAVTRGEVADRVQRLQAVETLGDGCGVVHAGDGRPTHRRRPPAPTSRPIAVAIGHNARDERRRRVRARRARAAGPDPCGPAALAPASTP